MLNTSLSRSPVVSLSIHRSRSWAAACSAWALEWRASPFEHAYSRCPRPKDGVVAGGWSACSLAVLLPVSTRVPLPWALCSFGAWSAAPLAVAGPSSVAAACSLFVPRAV